MNDKDKKGFFIVIGDSKIYPEKFLPNPIGVYSYQAYGELKKLQAENKKLREALEYYAKPNTWQHLTDDEWDEDIIGFNNFDDCYKHCEVDGVPIFVGGKRAREALKEVGEE